jgi:Ca-activated chloride channel homolog
MPGLTVRGRLAAVLCVIVALAAACTPGGPDEVTLRVLAGPDLADMQPVLDDLRRATGVRLEMDYRDEARAAEALTPGRYQHDLAWPASDASFLLTLKAAGYAGERPLTTRVMSSPVAVGITPEAAARLRGGDPARRLSWADLADAAAAGTLTFAMADPRAADSGLSALVGVATAAAGTGRALRPEDVACDRLDGFFAGQTRTAPVTAELVEQFVAHQDETDALVAYESTVLSLNAGGRLRRPLELLYPQDGLVLADFPLMLLDPDDRAAYDTVVAWLTGADAQRAIMERTLRRPVDPVVPRDQRLPDTIGNALYFPDDKAVLDRLLANYGAARVPGHVIFVLDHSGSMKGERLERLRATIGGFDGFARFYRGERVTLIWFGGTILAERTFTVDGQDDLDAMNAFLAAGELAEETAVWSALLRGYEVAAGDPGRPTSVVLMTDGESNAGPGLGEFLTRYRTLPAAVRAVHTYAIGLGGADPAALDEAARATGGRMIGADTASLQDAFEDVRGCV